MVISTDYQRVIDKFFTSPISVAYVYAWMIKAIGLTGKVDESMLEIVRKRFSGISQLRKATKHAQPDESAELTAERARRMSEYPLRDKPAAGWKALGPICITENFLWKNNRGVVKAQQSFFDRI